MTLVHVLPQPCCCASGPRPFQAGGAAHALPGILPAGITLSRRDLPYVQLPMRHIINYSPFYVRAADWAGVPSLFLAEPSHKCVSLSFLNTLTTKRPPTDLTNTILLVSCPDRKTKTISLPKGYPDSLPAFSDPRFASYISSHCSGRSCI